MIQNIVDKIKGVSYDVWRDIGIITVIVLVALASFGIGRLSVIYGQKEDFEIIYPHQGASALEAVNTASQEGQGVVSGGFVASKTGSKYHLPWCSGAQRIKESNKVFFGTKVEAEAAGYTPAKNCKGL